MAKTDLHGRLAVISGASSGIGAETARRLSAAGMRVAMIARRVERLESLAEEIGAQGGQALVIPADLSREDERLRVLQALAGERVDVLINNAGLGWYGFTAEMPWQAAMEMVQVNLLAALQFTWAFLPRMKAQGYGHIINISSIAGGLPQQGIAMYAATKSFLDSFTTSLYRELQGTPVHVSVLRPGPVETEFFNSSNRRSANGHHMPAERLAVPVERVAEAILRLLRRPRRVMYVPGWMAAAPLLEQWFGWAIDLLGPLLLKRDARQRGG